jgi:hypothetical protein
MLLWKYHCYYFSFSTTTTSPTLLDFLWETVSQFVIHLQLHGGSGTRGGGDISPFGSVPDSGAVPDTGSVPE